MESFVGGINLNMLTKNQLVDSIISYDGRARSTLMSKRKDELIRLYARYIVPNAPTLRVFQQQENIVSFSELIRNRSREIKMLPIRARILSQILQLENETIDIIRDIPIDLYNTFDQTLFNIVQRLRGRNLVFEYGNMFYTLNINNINRLLRLIQSNAVNIEDTTESDMEAYIQLTSARYFNIIRVYNPRRNQNAGAFFKYTTKFNMRCLRRYGIYNTFKSKNYNMNCFYNTMKIMGLKSNKLEELKTLIKGEFIPLSSIDEICKQLNINIIVKVLVLNKGKYECRNKKYGKKYSDEFTICLLDNHYFPYDKQTKFTSFSIKNYDKIKQHKDWNKVVKILSNGKPSRSNSDYIDSFNLVKLLIENKESVLDVINNSIEVLNSNIKIDSDFTDLNYTKKNIKMPKIPIGKSELNNSGYHYTGRQLTKYRKIFFDFETYSHGKNKVHKEYLCSYYDCVTSTIHTFKGSDCAYKMLQSLPENCLLLAHNARYDFTFILKHLVLEKYLPKGNSLFSASGTFFKSKFASIKILIKDTYKHISSPLSSFGKMFNLDIQKEVMPHSLVTDQTINSYISFDEVIKYYKNDDSSIRIMKENIIKWNIDRTIINNTLWFSLINYSAKYCEIDCKVLAEGYSIFRNDIFTVTKLDIDDYVSIASIGDAYFKLNGVYDDSFILSGVPRAFIQKCIVGGRTMSARNLKFYLKNWMGADFDALSLYASAMDRLGGILKGIPKILITSQLSYDFLKNQSGYFIQILIKSIGIKRDFPLISKFNDNGVRLFSNDMIGETIFIDKIGLEDLIEFQNVEFDIIRGYYFDEGRNNNLKNVINYLFNQRVIAKQNNNPIEKIYKLLMNSSYGKSILKPIDSSVKIFNNRESLMKYISNNFNLIKECICITNNKDENYNKYYVKSSKPIGSHFNSAHFGCEILSMSKRIMNEVMCTAEDNNLQIYYQDTDSMHISKPDVDKLSKFYYEKYNRILIGDKMGQFHVDFELQGAISDTIVATDTIILGKKCYIDKLEGNDKDNNIVHGYHVRMKGVSNKSIMYTSNGDLMGLYEKLYEGEQIKFDLCCGGDVKLFKYNKDMTVSFIDGVTDKGLVRTISF